jgi:hypothetical protein
MREELRRVREGMGVMIRVEKRARERGAKLFLFLRSGGG